LCFAGLYWVQQKGDKSMPTKYPPALSVYEAVSVIERTYKKHQDRQVAVDLMPEILDVKPSSSNLPAMISALQKFGLVKRVANDMLELTDLAMQIIKPVGDEKKRAIIAIFENSEVLDELYQKFGKTSLPSPEQLKQSLMKNFGVERDTVEKWYAFVTRSFRALSLIEQGPEREDVRITPGTGRINVGETGQLFKMPLPSSKVFEYTLDDEYTVDDLEHIIAYFNLLFEHKNKKK
jgi:hypothetical protein